MLQKTLDQSAGRRASPKSMHGLRLQNEAVHFQPGVEDSDSDDEKGTSYGTQRAKPRRKAHQKPQGSDQIRQAFSKRKKGLVLKAYQLYRLTDAKVFLFVVNEKGSSWGYTTPGFGAPLQQSFLKQLREMARVPDHGRSSTDIMAHPSIADHEESAHDRETYINSRKPSQTGTPTLGGGSVSGMATTAGGSPPTSSGITAGIMAGGGLLTRSKSSMSHGSHPMSMPDEVVYGNDHADRPGVPRGPNASTRSLRSHKEEGSSHHVRTSRPPSGSNSCSMVPSATFLASGPAGSSQQPPSSSQQVLDLGRQVPTGKGLVEPPTPNGMYNVGGGVYSDSPMSGPMSDPNSDSPHHIEGQHGFKGMGSMDAVGYTAQQRNYICGGGASTAGGGVAAEWNAGVVSAASGGGMQRMLPGYNTVVPTSSYGGYRMEGRMGMEMEAPTQWQPQQQQHLSMGMPAPMERRSRGIDFRMGGEESTFGGQGRELPQLTGSRVGEGSIDELSAYQASLPPLRTRSNGRTSPRGSWMEDDTPSLRVNSAPVGALRTALSMAPPNFQQQQQRQGIPIPGYDFEGKYVPNLKYEYEGMGLGNLGHREMEGGYGSYPEAGGYFSEAIQRRYWMERGAYEYERMRRHGSDHEPSPTAALSQHASALAVGSPMHHSSPEASGMHVDSSSYGPGLAPRHIELVQQAWQHQQQGAFPSGLGSSLSSGMGMPDRGLEALPLDDTLACVDMSGLVDDMLLADVNYKYMANERAQIRLQQQQQAAGLMGPPPLVGISGAAPSQGGVGGGQVMSERVQLLASSLQSLSEEDRSYARQQLLLKAQKAAMQQQGAMGASPTCSSGGSMLSRGIQAASYAAAVSAPMSAPMSQMLHGPSRLSSASPAVEASAAAAGPGGCSNSIGMGASMMDTCGAAMEVRDHAVIELGGIGTQAQAGEGWAEGDFIPNPARVVKHEGTAGQEGGNECCDAGHIEQEAVLAGGTIEQAQHAQQEPPAAHPGAASGSEGFGQVRHFSPSPGITVAPIACSSPLKRTTAQLAGEGASGVPEEAVNSPLKRPCNKTLPEPPSFNTLVQAEGSEDDLLAWGNCGSLANLVALGMKSPTDGASGDLPPVPEEDATAQGMVDADIWADFTAQ